MDLPGDLAQRLLAREHAPLGPLTTLGVGGPAPWVLEPRTRPEFLEAVRQLRAAALPFRVLGGGSNVLVCDEGVDEIVLLTRRMPGVYHHGEQEHALRAEAGASLARLVSVARELGLSGAEPLVGIPGTLGGAVVGNAGGRHGAIADVLTEVTVIRDDGTPEVVSVQPEDFGYRDSPFRGRPVLDAVLQLRPDADAAILGRMTEILREKRTGQPLSERSAGCMFKNPPGGSSGQLIEAAGCKGLAVGDAVISERHANFVLNSGQASARDVLSLIDDVRARVSARAGVELQLEVEIWGRRA